MARKPPPDVRVGQVWEDTGRRKAHSQDTLTEMPWLGRLVIAGATMRRGERWDELYPDAQPLSEHDLDGRPIPRAERIYSIRPYLVLRCLGVNIVGEPYVIELSQDGVRRHSKLIYDPHEHQGRAAAAAGR